MIIGQDRPDLPQSAGEMLHGRKRMRTHDVQVLLLLDPFVGFGHIGRRAAIDVTRHASVAPMLHVGGTETDTRHGCMPIARSCSSATASTSAHVKGSGPVFALFVWSRSCQEQRQTALPGSHLARIAAAPSAAAPGIFIRCSSARPTALGTPPTSGATRSASVLPER
jgi:hypothetical protein